MREQIKEMGNIETKKKIIKFQCDYKDLTFLSNNSWQFQCD